MLKQKQKYFVEDCLKLKLPKGLLNDKSKISGRTIVSNGINEITVDYNRFCRGRSYWLEIKAKRGNMGFSQEIQIDFDYTTPFGIRPYFLCECGKRCNILYLKPRDILFACRDCLGIIYELTMINRNTYGGEELYRSNRALKLENLKKEVKRIDYAGKLTRKATTVLALATKLRVSQMINNL